MDEHYFTASPSAEDRRFPLRVRLADRDLDLVSSTAVFSGHGLDKATAVLLDRLDEIAEPPADGVILDLGCGWGPIALTACVDAGKHDCAIEGDCRVRPHWNAVNASVRGAMAGITLASLSSQVEPA